MRLANVPIALLLTLGIAPAAFADPPRIDAVRLDGGIDRAQVVIVGAFDVPRYAVRSRDEGRTLVVDVFDAALPASGLVATGSSRLVVRTTASTTARGARIELGLARPTAFRARAEPGRIVLHVGDPEPGERVGDGGELREPEAPVIESVFLEQRDGMERVVLELSAPAAFRVVPAGPGPARLEVRAGRFSPQALEEVGRVRGAVVRGLRASQADDRAAIEVEQVDGEAVTAVREGRRIVWLFGAVPGARASTAAAGRREGRASPQAARAVQVDSDEVAAFLSDVPLQIDAARGGRTYGGRRIDLDFKDADIHNILRLLADVGGVNIVTSDDVQGTVTIRMRNVPWDQALEVILQAKGLGMVRRGNLIRVAPLETLEKEREAAIARQKQREVLAQLSTRIVPVSYARATDLSPRVRELLSGRGSVSVDERTNVLIVRDIAENLDDVEELVRTLDTQTPQVLVEARIVEATSQYTRDVGIQWGGDASMGTATGNPTGLQFPSDVSIAGGNYDQNTPTAGLSPVVERIDPSNFAVNLPAITGTGIGGALGLSFGSIGGNVNLAVRLSAAESNGVVRIISSPRILTLDNHEAHIAQGTLIPYSQVSAQGVQTAFQEAKLELRVRPHVTSDGSIAMHVRVTRDEPDFTRTSARGDPTILKREAETDLLVPDGHTAVIGGIYTRNTGRNVDQVPFFGDLPILGVLFQRRRVRDERNELLIFLTPRIVNRAEALQPRS
ncbi:MAG: type IV pilus secretin PilQ [Myxococcota bacterium]|nr:type IV pilus secretin PilQ [Myxococcota bacterium]MDW8362905.1 type IV pilus secretin PilQ [Myxococcales bacterium]